MIILFNTVPSFRWHDEHYLQGTNSGKTVRQWPANYILNMNTITLELHVRKIRKSLGFSGIRIKMKLARFAANLVRAAHR